MNRLNIAIGATHPDPLLSVTLEDAGHDCAVFKSTAAVLAALRRASFDGVILDVDRGAIAWRDVLAHRKSVMSGTFFVIAIGSRAGEALEAGADDFLGKALTPDELLARLHQAARRRHAPGRPEPLAPVSGCSLDLDRGCLTGRGGTAELTARELALAQLLFTHAGTVLSRRRLAREVWCADEELVAHSIEQHIYQLRRKLGRCAGPRLKLRGVYGGGYRLELQDKGETTCLHD